MKKVIIICFLMIVIIFTSCTSSIKSQSSENNKLTPYKSITISSPTFGAVKGIIISEVSEDRIGIVIYLGQVIEDSNGQSLAVLNTDNAPVANYDSISGEFSFSDVPPGNYSLIIHEVVFGGQAYVDEEGKLVIISVNQGSVKDVGNVKFDGF